MNKVIGLLALLGGSIEELLGIPYILLWKILEVLNISMTAVVGLFRILTVIWIIN